MNYRFHPDAFDEHHDSVAFYQTRLPGLGADYIAEFEAVMARVCLFTRVMGSTTRSWVKGRRRLFAAWRSAPLTQRRVDTLNHGCWRGS